MFQKFDSVVEKITISLALIGSLSLLVAIFVTCLSIVGKLIRRVFNWFFGADFNPVYFNWLRPILGEEEIVQFAVSITLFSILPLVSFQRQHIQINLLKRFFKPKVNQLLNIVADLSLVLIAYLMMTRQWYLIFKKNYLSQPTALEYLFSGAWVEFIGRIKMREESQVLSIPLWPFYIFAEICVIALFLVACYCLVKNILLPFVKFKAVVE